MDVANTLSTAISHWLTLRFQQTCSSTLARPTSKYATNGEEHWAPHEMTFKKTRRISSWKIDSVLEKCVTSPIDREEKRPQTKAPLHLSISTPLHLYTSPPLNPSTSPPLHLSTPPPLHLSTKPGELICGVIDDFQNWCSLHWQLLAAAKLSRQV